jgi:cysteine desulfurase
MDDRVLDAMLPYFKIGFANPSSTHHFGLRIKKEVDDAKVSIANLIGADSKEITITSGATESINLAIKGLALHPSNNKRHIVTLQTEHKAVLDCCKYLETLGFEIDYLPVGNDGLIDLENLKTAITDDTLLVCVMWVNNETGVIQDIKEISKLVNNTSAYFMTDATQAVGKMKTDVLKNEIDIMCFSAHKLYGPKGIGALYLNSKKVNRKNILAMQHGGGHESGLRSGTLNVPAIIGFAKAGEIALVEMNENAEKIIGLRNELENELLTIPGAKINGNKQKRLFNTLNICIPNFDATVFIGQHKNIAVSNGSACTSSLVEASHVLKAMGLSDDEALGSLRVSIGKENDLNEVHVFIEVFKKKLKKR